MQKLGFINWIRRPANHTLCENESKLWELYYLIVHFNWKLQRFVCFLIVSEMLVEARVSNEPMLEILVVQKKQMRGERGTKSQVTFISITLLYNADRFKVTSLKYTEMQTKYETNSDSEALKTIFGSISVTFINYETSSI